jgi:DNA primase
MDRIDFAKMKSISIASVLRHYGVETKQRGDYLVAKKCPLPTHASKEIETFKANTVGNWWKCWSKSCRKGKKDGGDVVDLVCAMENIDPLPAAQKLAELFWLNQNAPAKPERNGNGLSLANHGQRVADYADPSNRQLGQPAVAYNNIRNKPLGFTLQGIDPDHPYIHDRGISLETAMEFGVGFFSGKGSMSNRIVFPLFENGTLVGYAGRSVSDEDPKWKIGKGLVKSFLYGLERCDPAKPVLLVESAWGVLWFYQQGGQAAAMLGSELTESQEECLKPFTTVVVAMDNDETGKEAAEKICGRLRGSHKVIRAFLKE